MSDERWLPISGFDGLYEVSDHGRVRSWKAPGRGGPLDVPKVRALCVVHKSYLGVSFYHAGRYSTKRVHRLVMAAFGAAKPSPDFQIAHRDGDAQNNHIDNLAWKTCAENMADRERHGTVARGARNGRVRLTEDQVREMRRLYADGGVTIRQLADEFEVAPSTADHAIRGRNWAHV